MVKHTSSKLIKTTASIFAAAALVACGGGGSSGGGKKQAVGKLMVKEIITIDDTIAVEFTDCKSSGFKAMLDGVNVTALFADTKGTGNNVCEKTASAYALQGILGERAQAGGESELTVKATGRTDISASFVFRAWPELTLARVQGEGDVWDEEEYKDLISEVTAGVFNALIPANSVNSDDVWQSDGDEKSLTLTPIGGGFFPNPFSFSVKAESGLSNTMTLSTIGEEIKDSIVIQFASTEKGNVVLAEWFKDFINADLDKNYTNSSLSFTNKCGEEDKALCPVLMLDNESYEFVIESHASKLFTAKLVEGEAVEGGVADRVIKLFEALASELNDNQTAGTARYRTTAVKFTAPALVSFDRKLTSNAFFNTLDPNYFMETPSGSQVARKEFGGSKTGNDFYLALPSTEANQLMLANFITGKLDQDGKIHLCVKKDSELDCTLRNELVSMAVPIAQDMLEELSSGVVSRADAKRLVENILPANENTYINYDVKFKQAPYVRFLETYTEAAAHIASVTLSLNPAVKKDVCNALTGSVLGITVRSICAGNIAEGYYGLRLEGLALKQRAPHDENGVVMPPQLIETSIDFDQPLGFLCAQDGCPRYEELRDNANYLVEYDDLLSKKDALPMVYELFNELPIDAIANIDLGDLTETAVSRNCLSRVDESDAQKVLDSFFGYNKETKEAPTKYISFEGSQVAIDKTTEPVSPGSVAEAKHWVLSGGMTNDKEKANIIIDYKDSCDSEGDELAE